MAGGQSACYGRGREMNTSDEVSCIWIFLGGGVRRVTAPCSSFQPAGV